MKLDTFCTALVAGLLGYSIAKACGLPAYILGQLDATQIGIAFGCFVLCLLTWIERLCKRPNPLGEQ